MWDKRHYATYIVGNLCFDAATVRPWLRRVRSRGVALPIFFGLAGPVDRSKLLNVATKIGVRESARFLTGHAGWFLRMGTPGGYDPVGCSTAWARSWLILPRWSRACTCSLSIRSTKPNDGGNAL